MKKKTIFTIMTLGLVTLLGFGFLGGIHYQPKEVKASEITTTPTKKQAKITFSDDYYGSDKILYFVAKNYSQNGKGVFYEGDTINLENSVPTGNVYRAGSGQLTIIKNTTYIETNLGFQPAQSAGVYHLSQVYLTHGSTQTFIYEAYSGTGNFNRNNCAFVGYIRNATNKQDFNYYVNLLFDVYIIQENYFQFADTINYNATYGQDLDSFVVNDSYFSDNSYLFKEITLFSGVPFYSGGLVFDTITLSFDNAYATKLRTTDNNIQAWSSFNFGYFQEMRYKNSATNLIVAVNTRIFEAYYNANESGLYLTRNSKWVSKNYQKITFFNNVSETNLTSLSKLNNTSFTGGYYEGYSTQSDVGLGSAFALISQAFTAWLPILQVTIVPGITLGLLLFLPLIAGIIIFIIWIVKR